jgi:hypothetical protein
MVQVWASKTKKHGSVLVTAVKSGLTSASFAVDPSCAHGCSLSVLLSWPQQTTRLIPLSVPLHPTLDDQAAIMQVARPATESFLPVLSQEPVIVTDINIKQASSEAAPSGNETIVEPGSMMLIDMNATQCVEPAGACSGIPPGQDVQIMVFAVDKAWLILQPYELPDAESFFEAALGAALAASTSSSGLINPESIALWKEVCVQPAVLYTDMSALKF